MNLATTVQGLATISWLAVFGIIALAVIRAGRGKPIKRVTSLIVGLLVVAILVTSAGLGLVFLQADENGVVISAIEPNGYRAQTMGSGLHWIIPFVESVKIYSIGKETYTMSSTTGEGAVQGDDSIQARTKDGQQVFIDASVIYSIDPKHLLDLHKTWQNRYVDNVVRPVVRSAIRDAVAQYGIEEIVSTKRSELETTISNTIRQGLNSNDLIMQDFLMRNIRFSDQYAAAVEQKQIAEQQALQAQLVVEQKKQEAEQARQTAQGSADAVVISAKGDADARVIQAKAEADALNLIAEALKNKPDLLQYQYITKLAPGIQVMLVPNNNPYLLPLPQLTPTQTPSTSTP
jgi:regulator of protease activity HflC (stomatin/prohibitin superfamily)